MREGAALGVPTPYNQAVTWMVTARQTERMQSLHGAPIDYEALEAQILGSGGAATEY